MFTKLGMNVMMLSEVISTANLNVLINTAKIIPCQYKLLVSDNTVPSMLSFSTLIMLAKYSPKGRLLQEPHGIKSHKTAFFNSLHCKYICFYLIGHL
jgi:hypothetical protein